VRGAGAGRLPLPRRPPLGRSAAPAERAAGASREAVVTCAPPRSPILRGRAASQNLSGLSSPMPPLPFSLRRNPRALGRSTKRHNTKGRQGSTDRISLWREITGMIQDKGLAVKCRTRSPRCVRNLELLWIIGKSGSRSNSGLHRDKRAAFVCSCAVDLPW
jgi:hypothetical protein